MRRAPGVVWPALAGGGFSFCPWHHNIDRFFSWLPGVFYREPAHASRTLNPAFEEGHVQHRLVAVNDLSLAPIFCEPFPARIIRRERLGLVKWHRR